MRIYSKEIPFLFRVLVFLLSGWGAFSAQADVYYQYVWQPTTGGEFSTVDDVKGWKRGNEPYGEYNQYYLQQSQSAPLTLANDWTLPGLLHVWYAPYVFNFGTSTLTLQKGFYVDYGGELTISDSTKVVCSAGSYLGHTYSPGNKVEILSGSDVAFRSVYIGSSTASSNNLVVVDNAKMSVDEPSDSHKAYLCLGGNKSYSCGNTLVITNGGQFTSPSISNASIGYCGADNRLIATGEGSTFEWGSGNVYVGNYNTAGEWDGVPLGTNTILITDHAQAALSNSTVYVGYSSTNSVLPKAGLENRIEVTGGATLSAKHLLVYPGASFCADHATVNVYGIPQLRKGTCASFNDSTVSFGLTANGSFGDVEPEYSDAEIAFSNSTVSATREFWMGGANFVMRLHNSTATMKQIRAAVYDATGKTTVPCDNTIVFSGAAPQLTLSDSVSYQWYPDAKLRFEISKAGFPTDRPIMDAQGTYGFGKYGDDAGTRTVEISVDSGCPDGTYTLMRGNNATNDWITIDLNYDPSQTKAEIIRTTIDGAHALQVKVTKCVGLMLLFK